MTDGQNPGGAEATAPPVAGPVPPLPHGNQTLAS